MIEIYAARGDRTSGGTWIPIVSKIEKPQALTNLEAIVDVSDAIMVARGDLGVEMDIAQVPVAQKRIVAESARQGKPCIVATQMLETMIDNTTPTRAEASDVANAVFDGADAVMLSAETATGKHPALVVETMSRIVAVAEQRFAEINNASTPPTTYSPDHLQTAALAHATWYLARDLHATLIACWSEGGGTARYLSQNNFNVPILAFTSDERVARRMALYCAVIPVRSMPPANRSLHAWDTMVLDHARSFSLAKDGDWIVMLAGRPLGQARATNALAVLQVGRPVPLHEQRD
jgi:pyruvate kinase